MAELTLSDHRLLAGTHVATDYMGDHIAALAGRFVPGLDANENGSCEKVTVDHIESLVRLLRNAPQVYVYKDSTDTDLQFSVRPFSIDFGGIQASYAGAVNISGLSAGNTRYIYAILDNAPTVTIGVAAAYPTTSNILRLGAIAAPASGPWLPENFTSAVAAQTARVRCRQRMLYELDFAYNSGATVPIVTLPVGATVLRCNLRINTLFNGSSPTINIGDSGSNSRFMASATAIPGSTGNKKNDDLIYKYASSTTVNVYIGGSGASTGAATVILEVMI